MNRRIKAIDMPLRPQRRSVPGRLWHRSCRVARADDGVSAVEFALLAPMLVFAVLATVDIGRALTERMTIDHVLRAGAQSATAGGSVAAVDQVLRTTAAKNFQVTAPGVAGNDSSLAITVSAICECAQHPGMPVACSTTCLGSTPTQVLYALSGTKTYSGIIIPSFGLSPTVRVQVR